MKNNFNSSYVGIRYDILSEIESACESVLDLGCATGENGKYLLESKLVKKIYGVEFSKEMAEEAKKIYTSVVVGNLDDTDILAPLSSYSFDYILAGDILEHLENPWKLLKTLSTMVKKDGKIIISLPNIQHVDVFIHLFFKGQWPVNKRGIFDKTHRRFFTFNNIKQLIEGSGLKIERVKHNFRYRDAVGSRFPWYGFLLKRLFTKYYTFQYIITCINA